MAFSYPYPRPSLTVDCVVFGIEHGEESKRPELQVLMIRRAEEPFKGFWALPGGFVNVRDDADQGESLEAAARRELQEETGIEVDYLEQLYTFATPGRDPRGRVVSVAYYAMVRSKDHAAKAGSDAADARWLSLGYAKKASAEHQLLCSPGQAAAVISTGELELDGRPHLLSTARSFAFDHSDILKMALERLQGKIRYAPIGFNLLPPKFTMANLQSLYEMILMRPVDKRNFRKRFLAMGILVEAGMETNTGKPGPAANLYRFDKRAYDRAVRQGWNFEV